MRLLKSIQTFFFELHQGPSVAVKLTRWRWRVCDSKLLRLAQAWNAVDRDSLRGRIFEKAYHVRRAELGLPQ